MCPLTSGSQISGLSNAKSRSIVSRRIQARTQVRGSQFPPSGVPEPRPRAPSSINARGKTTSEEDDWFFTETGVKSWVTALELNTISDALPEVSSDGPFIMR